MAAAPTTRPSLRTIARMAGVSAMTVSRVLRNLGKVSARKRAQVRKIADQLGYRPDPIVAKLMYHLRGRHKPAFQGVLCALTTIPLATHWDFSDEIISGARQRAESLGYGFSLLHLDRSRAGLRALQRMLRARGVEGILLLPLFQVEDVSTWLDWSQFSVVATSGSILAPAVHRVLPSQFNNTLVLCRQLTARGYQRIGFVIDRVHDLRVGHTFTAAVEWHGHHESRERVAPWLFDGAKVQPQDLLRWYKRERPDVILASQDRSTRRLVDTLGLKMPGPVGLARTSSSPNSIYSGIDECPASIGATAVEQVTALIQRGEKGLPTAPTVTLLPGRWLEGQSCPIRKQVSG
jgi:DNA-binding LacI/PurR family transcriptional regulator